MIRAATAIAALSIFASGAMAQTTPPAAPSTPPATVQPMPAPVTPVTPSVTTPAPATTVDGAITLTDAQAKAWINKTVYSSDNKNLGEVAAFARDASGKVTEMHADIGGFLGIGETRVRVMPDQFKLDNDHIVLNVTAAEAKALPAIKKQ